MSQQEDIYEWMSKQKFPLDKAGVQKVSAAKLAELREVGFKFVSVLGTNSADDCEACRAVAGQKIEIQYSQPLPLSGCDKEFCKCIYLAQE